MIDLKFDSPVEEVFYDAINQQQIRLFMKRDDLIHPFISGNKWRKLKYNLLTAQKENKNHILTFGGAFSNHLLATAAAGAQFHFKTTAFVRGEEVSNPTLNLCRLFGMKLVFVSREAYRDKEVLAKEYLKNDDHNYYVIPEGGYGALAEQGCREIIAELTDAYDYIFCAAGTGATAAGIINGKNEMQINSEIHIISVLKGGDFLKEDINALLDSVCDYTLHTDYHFGGYAKTTAPLIEFIKSFTQSTGILIDPVYTAKTLYAIQDLAIHHYFKPQAKVLMIHTGGIFGILGMQDKLS